jgi:DNA-binding phage protein
MESLIGERYAYFKNFLNERDRRLLLAVEAKVIGHGGIQQVADQTGASRTTISTGLGELEEEAPSWESSNRVRKEGGGRKSKKDQTEGLAEQLEKVVEPTTAGAPEQPLKWTSKSLRKISDALKAEGFNVSHQLVGDLLTEMGFILQANRKKIEGKNHPDRDDQFHYISEQVMAFQHQNAPVISVDTKKKELVGPFKNQGREWHKKGEAEDVLVHDFSSQGEGTAIPYGVYEITQNEGWVNVGITHDTATFAVESIRRWWQMMGSQVYQQPKSLLITADGGGSNGAKVRLWKVELQKFANELGIPISICHFPPATSKWNKIEHRLFSFITQNWRGKPLISYRTIVNLISNTTNKGGLIVKSELDKNQYEKGIKVTDQQLAEVNIHKADFHGEWNYTIHPQK